VQIGRVLDGRTQCSLNPRHQYPSRHHVW